MKNYISPSLLAADKNNLQDEIFKVEKLGAEYIHWDVMDGKFVPELSFENPKILEQNAKVHKMINDVHIMVEQPFKVAQEYLAAGADIITLHYEAACCSDCIQKIVDLMHSAGKKVGISIKPRTNPRVIKKFLKDMDLVLVMSVEPGYGGQEFIPKTLKKIKKLRTWIDKNNYNCLIEVDGGINEKTGKLCRDAGVDILVAGSYLFSHDDIKERFEKLR